MKKLLITILAAVTAILPGCAGQTAEMPAETAPAEAEYAEGAELLCMAEDEAEAMRIAELYGIELADWNGDAHIAVFHTEENPYEVIKRGKEQGFPTIEINYINHALG